VWGDKDGRGRKKEDREEGWGGMGSIA